MATLTYYDSGSVLANQQGVYPATSIGGVTNTLSNLPDLFFTTESPTTTIGDFRLLNEPGTTTTFQGSSFTYDGNGTPTGGVTTSVQENINGSPFFSLSNIAVSVVTLLTWIQTGEYAQAAATVFAGNDTIIAAHGKDVIDGWGGINMALLPDVLNQDRLTGSPITGATVTSGDVDASLTSIQRIQFIDGTDYFASGSSAAQITRLYTAALGRAPDALGLTNWVSVMNGGGSSEQVAASFIASTEFQTRFPAASGSSVAFVTQLSANVLHRAPDAGGLTGWVGQLQSGAETQAQVLVGFSESAENQTNTAGGLANGIWVANEQAASVARLYSTTLDRAPDAGGLIAWTNDLANGSQTLSQEATSFVASAEFQGKFGALSTNDFVTLLYSNVLGRAPDAGGLTSWTNALNNGSQSRAQVVVGFSESQEHKDNMMSMIEAQGVVLAG